MLTAEENERYTKVGKGTPCGELMRRYWHPIAASGQLPQHGTRPVTILGERLVLYRDRSGKLGLVEAHCPHRRGGMVFGIPEENGIRCAYHGWLFDGSGSCLEQPYEKIVDPKTTFKDRVRIQSYPVEELGGLIFAYLGPEPATLLPRWDLFVKEDVVREIGWAILPCNWLQAVENALDPSHVISLHGRFSRYVLERLDCPTPGREFTRVGGAAGSQRLLADERTEFGWLGKRFVDGEWSPTAGLVFPYMVRTPDGTFQIAVPIDDTHTIYIYYFTFDPVELKTDLGLERSPEADPRKIPVFDVPVPEIEGVLDWRILDNNSGQDLATWRSQGEITDRTREHLGHSDRGVIFYRQMLAEQLGVMQNGGEPMNVFRDPARNKFLAIPCGPRGVNGALFSLRNAAGVDRTFSARKYSPIFRAAAVKERGEAALNEPVH